MDEISNIHTLLNACDRHITAIEQSIQRLRRSQAEHTKRFDLIIEKLDQMMEEIDDAISA